MEEILSRIPQRKPFLFVDKILDRTENSIQTGYLITGKEDFFKGHFPGQPIMPGVILSEACFQTGALLMSYILEGGINDKLAVVSRIQGAKFKNLALPGDELTIAVEIVENMGHAAYLKGKVRSDSKLIMSIEFAVTLTDKE